MNCPNCHYSITPGMEISLDPLKEETSQCPICLHVLPREEADDPPEEQRRNVSVKRFTMRRRVREQFVDRLLRVSTDGNIRCPECNHSLNKGDQILIRNTEYFKCHRCGHDFATIAYRREVYHEQRWLPVVHALGDLRAEKKCVSCRYLGAMAKACQRAFSWMPGIQSYSKHSKLISTLLAQPEWVLPDDECYSSCVGVRQYRALAAEGLFLL